jgi:hypothetical protein
MIFILFALKGVSFRGFYCWWNRNFGNWLGQGQLPDATLLQRLLKTHQDWTSVLLSEPTFFTVIDSYPIGLLFPVREKRIRPRLAE